MDRVTEFLESEFPDAEERALLLGIVASPTDKTAKLVYADWLDDRSDPRAEYVRLLVARGRRKPLVRMNELRKACSGPWLSMMGELQRDFATIAKKVETRPDLERGWRETLWTTFDRGLWQFQYKGNLWLEEHGLSPVLDFICDPKIAAVLWTLDLDAYDDHPQTNGTLHLSLVPLTTGKVSFPYLDRVSIEQSQNTVLGKGGYHEDGETARLLALCPRLRQLTGPSAPNAKLFTGPKHPLEALNIHAGYDTEDFVKNLAKSERFPRLRTLRYKDFCCEYMDPQPQMFTSFKDWKTLFRSPWFAKLEEVELSGVLLTEDEVKALLKIRSQGVTITRSPSARTG
ncbi:MAG: TIGR02996 domain-containing protein [Planctomycetes bacterium]|nr:TIGR02996 domain-containing protein [Planctomycetota bacterium]